MSYSVIHMQKLKMGAMKGIENHNERLKESRTNPDISAERSHHNYDLHRLDDQRTYYMRIKDRIKELNLPRAVRKDAVVAVGFITTSDKPFFDGLTPKQNQLFFKASYDFLKKRYGEENVISSKVHLDEKTPHMHTYVVPVTEDGRLSAKRIFTPAELRSLQADYNQHMRDHGFDLEKGEATRKHIEMAEYKKQTAYQELEDVEKKVEHLTNEKDTLLSDLNALKNDFKRLGDIKVGFDQIDEINAEYGFVGKKKVKIAKEDFDFLKNIGKRQHILETKIDRLTKENSDLMDDIETFKKLDKKNNNTKILDKINGMEKELETVKGFLEESDQLQDYYDFRQEQKHLKKEQQKAQIMKDELEI